jgi:hypothetical protein
MDCKPATQTGVIAIAKGWHFLGLSNCDLSRGLLRRLILDLLYQTNAVTGLIIIVVDGCGKTHPSRASQLDTSIESCHVGPALRVGLDPSPTCLPGQGGHPKGDAASATNRVVDQALLAPKRRRFFYD